MAMKTKKAFLEQLNEAFAQNDVDFLAEHITDDISWTMVGDFTIKGKEAFINTLEEMKSNTPFELAINNIIIDDHSAGVEGTMTSPEGTTYAFCDIYTLSGSQHLKIQTLKSYVIRLNQ